MEYIFSHVAFNLHRFIHTSSRRHLLDITENVRLLEALPS